MYNKSNALVGLYVTYQDLTVHDEP